MSIVDGVRGATVYAGGIAPEVPACRCLVTIGRRGAGDAGAHPATSGASVAARHPVTGGLRKNRRIMMQAPASAGALFGILPSGAAPFEGPRRC